MAGSHLLQRVLEGPWGKFIVFCLQGQDIANGIEHMHAVGYAHRDIKPENVLLADDYTVRLADFGFATAKLQATEVAGTPNYASPEMRAGTQYNT